ncbi:hypothetical protein [Bacteroidetes bacterium endosymbiont of Geopemphigus sp.]|uniref:hypothetical protein n=1 Tax=Bacteroidetes bacterium endosymbiont of Geopemphigus sp. TaxID=2047937 RepID=UPI000CD027C8|nr:hypothetical protein [Bacteroidetes bacterium endosymbiont of Geopemphigus sp.]
MNARASEITDSLKYVLLKEGSHRRRYKIGRSGSSVHYTLWLENGRKIGSSLDKNESFTHLL